MAMIKTLFLVPVRDNDGKPFPPSAWRELDQRLRSLGQGYSIEGVTTGVWQVCNRIFRDRSRRYVVALTSWAQLSRRLAVVQWARVRFQQEAIYIEVAGIPEIIGIETDNPSAPPPSAPS